MIKPAWVNFGPLNNSTPNKWLTDLILGVKVMITGQQQRTQGHQPLLNNKHGKIVINVFIRIAVVKLFSSDLVASIIG